MPCKLQSAAGRGLAVGMGVGVVITWFGKGRATAKMATRGDFLVILEYV